MVRVDAPVSLANSLTSYLLSSSNNNVAQMESISLYVQNNSIGNRFPVNCVVVVFVVSMISNPP